MNLEPTIAAWRQQMLSAGIQSPATLDELENHLREEIERQLKSGLSLDESEAFHFAARKIGSAEKIKMEFSKVELAETERAWKRGQIWLGILLGSLQLTLLGAILFNSEMTFSQRLSGLTAMATSFLLVVIGRLSHQIFPVQRGQRIKTATIFILGNLPGMIWIGIFAGFILPANTFPFGAWLATALWASCPPLGVYLGLILGSQIAVRNAVAQAS